MLNPLRLPRVLKDSLRTMQASLPHGQKAAEANGEWLELIFELRERDSELSDEERAAMRERLGQLQEVMRREGRAAERPFEELSARHPDWVDY
jgi:hypothetical protein